MSDKILHYCPAYSPTLGHKQAALCGKYVDPLTEHSADHITCPECLRVEKEEEEATKSWAPFGPNGPGDRSGRI